MSTETVKKIIGRAVVEAEFREVLFAEPVKALAGYELTDEERPSSKTCRQPSSTRWQATWKNAFREPSNLGQPRGVVPLIAQVHVVRMRSVVVENTPN